MIVKEENKDSVRINRQRVSMYGMDRNKKIEIAQNKYFPLWALSSKKYKVINFI